MYDIRYDTGEELRFVRQDQLRLLSEKGAYAYRVEVNMAFLIISAPVALAATFLISPAVMCLGMFFISSQLLFAQITTFLRYMYSYYAAGCCVIFRQVLVYMFPLVLFWIAAAAGVLAVGAGIPWMYIGGNAMPIMNNFSCVQLTQPSFS